MLDAVEKIMRILFTTLLGGVVAVAGLKIQWEKVGVEADETCFGQFDRIKALLLAEEVISKALVQRYASRCDISLEQAGAELNASKAVVEMASSETTNRTVTAFGRDEPSTVGDGPVLHGGADPDATFASNVSFVALGRVNTDVYAQVNFDRLDGKPATGDGSVPAIGDKLRSRWDVNLRRNTEVTTGGQNPVTGLVSIGQCVELVAAPAELRGQYWAPVKPIEC